MTSMKQSEYTLGLFLTSVSVFTSLTGLQKNKKQNIKLGTFSFALLEIQIQTLTIECKPFQFRFNFYIGYASYLFFSHVQPCRIMRTLSDLNILQPDHS